MSSCKSCDNQISVIETQSEIIQKRIQNQVRVPSSMYTMNFAALNSRINNNNVGVKYDSYQRRLNKLKQKNNKKRFINRLKNSNIPLIGNKASDYEIVSSNINADNYLSCGLDFNKYLQNQGTQKAYDNFSQLANAPNTLTLGSGDISYNFGGYIDDLTLFNFIPNPKINYANYSTGSTTTNGKDFLMSQLNKLLVFIDFKFNVNASNAIIFEIGGSGGGISTYFYNNKLFFMVGASPSGTNSSFHYEFPNIQSDQNKNILAIELIKLNDTNSNNLSVQLYYNNELVISEIKSFNKNYLIFGKNNIGFAKKGGISITLHDVTNNIVVNSIQAAKNITGQYKIFENNYQEVLRSNYFSNL